jgi:hypothetical protein
MRLKSPQTTGENSEIPLKYMAYLASDSDRLMRFCDISGMGPRDLQDRLLEPDFQAFLLDFLLQDESELLAFAAEQNLRPETIVRARAALPGQNHDF